MRIQKYLRPHVAYTNRIRPSTRIRFVSGHLKGLVNRACGKRLVLILWRQRIQKYTDTSMHTYPDTQRIQKFPLWRAYTEISWYSERIRRTRVDARCIRIKKFADTKISGYVWTGPKTIIAIFCHYSPRFQRIIVNYCFSSLHLCIVLFWCPYFFHLSMHLLGFEYLPPCMT